MLSFIGDLKSAAPGVLQPELLILLNVTAMLWTCFFQRTYWQRYEPSGELVESPPLSKYESVKQDLEGYTSEEKLAIPGKVECIATVELDVSYV